MAKANKVILTAASTVTDDNVPDMEEGEKSDGCGKVAEWMESLTRQKPASKELSKKRISSKGIKSLKRWFGDETEPSEQSEDSESDWGQVERVKRNKLKRKTAARNRELRVCQTFKKAQHIIGLGPVSEDDINEHMENPQRL